MSETEGGQWALCALCGPRAKAPPHLLAASPPACTAGHQAHCVSVCASSKHLCPPLSPMAPKAAGRPLTCCSSVSWVKSWWVLYSVRNHGPFSLALA